MSDVNNPAETIGIKIVKEFKAPAEKVFDAWIDPEWLSRWMFGPDVRDEKILKLETNPEIKGAFSFVVQRGEMVINHVGHYVEVQRPNRLIFTWGIESESEDESVVTINIESTEKGCLLTLTHELDPKWKEYADRTKEGWSFMLDKLKHLFKNKE